MNYIGISTCKECMNSRYDGNGEFFCKVIGKMVIVTDVPSEHHFECKKIYGRIPFVTELKRVGQYTKSGRLLKIHQSATDAANDLGIKPGGIYQCISGRQKSYHGFKWAYMKEDQI